MQGRLVAGFPVLDALLAAAVAFAWVGGILTGEVNEGPLAVTLPVAVVSSAALLWRSRATLAAVGAVVLAQVAQTLLADESPGTVMSFLVMVVIAYAAGADLEETPAGLALGMLIGSAFFGEWHDRETDYVFLVLVLGGTWLLGRGARSLRSRATYAEQHQRDLARLAVVEERSRIARELHDVVAHSLSVIAVQADAAEAALGSDPPRAREPLRAIRGSARDALTDMRQLLRVLRPEEDGTDRSPVRGVDDLDGLVTSARESGLALSADIAFAADPPSGLGLAVYRIVQEGLTNVRKHAGAVPTSLLVCGDDREIRIVVANDAGHAQREVAPSTGQGLRGLRERTEAAGGTLRCGPTPSGGFELVVVLPVRGAAT